MLKRREILRRAGAIALAPWLNHACSPPSSASKRRAGPDGQTPGNAGPVRLFLCGDVMTGRGIDQVLPFTCPPEFHKRIMASAHGYVDLAESVSGPIPEPVSFSYVWGDALQEFEKFAPDARIINLETAVTTSGDRTPKAINYRMHPRNVPCLTAAGIDCCVLANNHILDWGESGLAETIDTLHRANLKTAGAGRTLAEAQALATIQVRGASRVIVLALGARSAGIPSHWAATQERPGVAYLPDLSDTTAIRIAGRVRAVKRPGDVVVASIHWGGNFGYRVPPAHREFAHMLVDLAGVDIVHGHSSHHPMGIEVYKNRPILYGCGDFLNDYEGIDGKEEYRGHLVLMYFLTIDPSTGELLQLDMRPLEIKRFQLHRASPADARWLQSTLHREGARLGTEVELDSSETLRLGWR